MEEYHLDLTKEKLTGPSPEHIALNNQWAAIAFNNYHENSSAEIEFSIHGETQKATLKWDSNFSTSTMKERIDMANHGGVAMAWFVMSVLLDYSYVEQSEIGEGTDYHFMKIPPADDELNFFSNDGHYVEVSGILEESNTNTLRARVKSKHDQIDRGTARGTRTSDDSSSVIVTLFSQPKTVKEIH